MTYPFNWNADNAENVFSGVSKKKKPNTKNIFNYSDRNLYLFSPSISFQIFVIETCKNIIKKINIIFKKSRMFQNVQKWGLKLPKNTPKIRNRDLKETRVLIKNRL